MAIKGKDLERWFRLVQEVKVNTEQVVIFPKMWARFKAKHGLKWTRVPFDQSSKPIVPTTTGLYAFAVRPPADDFPPSNWLFYIGEVGATGGRGRHLRARFGEYLDELKVMTRPSVAFHLKNYFGYVDFYYCELDHQANDIKSIESKLITSLWPWSNIADYEVDVRLVRRAFP